MSKTNVARPVSVIRLGAWLVSGLLLLFAARRWIFTLAALWPARGAAFKLPDVGPDLPEVLLLAPFRNEARALPGLLLALHGLDYPPGRLTVALVDDGSTDGSEALAQAWSKGRDNWRVLSLPQNRGKAAALNAALAALPGGAVIAVYDADEQPRPDALRALAAHMAEPDVGGVSGRRVIANGLASPAAGYTTLEGLVHQLVTMRAKDRLNLAPALLGSNCAYRREALVRAGCFEPGALLEDSDLTLKLARAGWRTRFEPTAISYHAVPQTLAGYWRQHTRWARGFNEVARSHLAAVLQDSRLAPGLRLELAAFALGYLDRLALLAAVGLVLLRVERALLVRVLLLSLATPLGQAVAALYIERAPPALWARLAWLPLFFGADVAMAAAGLWAGVRRAPRVWEERGSRP